MTNRALRLPFFAVTQNVGTFYSCVIEAQDLLQICKFDFRKIAENGGVKEFLGIQRPLNEARVREIRKFIETEDGSFPTSIVISVEEACASISTEDGVSSLVLSPSVREDTGEIVIDYDSIATIIDGQHRLKAFEGSKQNWKLSVNVFVGVDEGTRAMIFSKVNLAQTKVNKSLVYDLFALDRGRSPEKTCHEIVVNLNEIPSSPFFEKIKRLGSATEGVFGETLSQATIVRGILPLITNDPIMDRDIGRRVGVFPDRGPADFERRIFYPFFRMRQDEKILANIINYFNAIKARWPEAWNFSGRGAVLQKTNGYDAAIRFLRDAYLFYTSEPTVVSTDKFLDLFGKCELTDKDFTTMRFPPGTSGSSALYREFERSLPK